MRGFIDIEKAEADSLLRYIHKNYKVYDFVDISHNDKSIAFSCSSRDPSFKSSYETARIPETDFYYSMIISQAESYPERIQSQLEYFIVVVNHKTRFPHREVETGNLIAMQQDEGKASDPLDEYIAGGSWKAYHRFLLERH